MWFIRLEWPVLKQLPDCARHPLSAASYYSLPLFHYPLSRTLSSTLSLIAVPFQAVLLFMHFSLVLHARRANHMHFSRFLSLFSPPALDRV